MKKFIHWIKRHWLERLWIEPFLPLENDSDEIAIANAFGGGGVFELKQEDSFFVPYGQYPHAKGLQIFDRESAEEMRTFANSLFGRTMGIPIYRGHPDVPGRPDTNPAAPAQGWIQDVVVEENGARFPHKLGKAGNEAIANAEFRFYSPHWLLKPVKGGLKPVRLLSMGLTNNPRINVPAIANDEPANTEEPMNPQILKLLGLDAAANDGKGPTEEEIITAAEALGIRIVKIENDSAAVLARATEAEAKLTKAVADLATAQQALVAANDRATQARSLIVDSTLDRAIAAGRLTAGDREARRAELVAIANDDELKTKLGEIESARPVLKTESQLGDLSKAREKVSAANDAAGRSALRNEAIEAEMKSIANDLPPSQRFDIAWTRAAKKHPELFTNAPAKAA